MPCAIRNILHLLKLPVLCGPNVGGLVMGKITGRSLQRLNTCDERLQLVIHKANNVMEMSVLCGVRSKEAQNQAYDENKSKVRWPHGKHNITDPSQKSKAVDVIPYFMDGKEHYDWEDLLAFARLAGVILTIAKMHDINLRWGGDWDNDGRSADERFQDLVHFELME